MSLLKEFVSRRALLVAEHSRKIFGHMPPNVGNLRNGRKRLKWKPSGPGKLAYYPEKEIPQRFDPVVQYRKDKLNILKETGRTPPAKGQGKRSK
eukprot:CAMPEP_0197517626 /NCGR_PEP_ID=MMETSP1318-20131121/2675_1 /TAXON_ID=552666 /ORGANISM="Partenskyella glossopodia, Strain RCC365" /LENGTH=93 /DNA_ID=CAMNT_0043067351 /DNA_START=65 /DNA_END=346 /DNA_ORIENTATION=+